MKKEKVKKEVKKHYKKNQKEGSYEKELVITFSFCLGFLIIGGILLNIGGAITGNAFLEDLTAGSEIAKNTISTFSSQILKPLFEWLLGEVSSGEYFFAKVLFFLFMLGLVYALIGKVIFFKEHSKIGLLFTFIVAYFTMRSLGDTKVLEVLFLPYGALGISLGSLGAFVVWFLIVNKGLINAPSIVRKSLWILFGVVLAMLSFYRSDLAPLNYIYLLAGALSAIMALMDGTVKKFIVKAKHEKENIIALQGPLRDITDNLSQIARQFAKGEMEPEDFKKQRAEILKRKFTLQE